ncbi:helix-turn-helix domain-containing protein [Thermoanaerobacterium butyriciformans]|uniref:AraC-like DNA-binding protein n=1 Tax=Thermoanaerobacterium butyriciformans TaxID=1702242 RepID=A0ABS4NBS1_9THEO|nr:AraC family transcriptional regulator [Thermoanaerobacterium butyriciformans]MBP2071075.1 AraC-like DNA-binding protein [Thermoanaerobacterium butyriciformans]
MEYKYELIKNDDNLPIKIIYHTSDERQFIPRHWHESIEISYVLSGRIDDIYIDGVNYTSKQGDIVLINSNAIHSFSVDQGKNRKAVTFFISYEFIKANYPDIDQIAFDCVSINENDEQKIKLFNELRKNLDSIIKAFLNIGDDSLAHIKIMGLSYELIYLLLRNFKISKKSCGEIKTQKYLDRLTQITNYIKENYNQDLSIDVISAKFNLSPEYLSRFFKKYMGMTILNYINAVRLEKSYRDLMNTDQSITEIALEHGFPNEKSFNKVFKTFYNITPNQYRKKIKALKSVIKTEN